MVEASWRARTKRLLGAVAIVAASAGGAGGLPGCSFVPRSRLDECRRLSQTLQAEKEQLKDTAVTLRSQNQDLNQRAADDARRLRLQEEEVHRLVQSVSAYQQEREQMAAAYERLKARVASAATTTTASAAPPATTTPPVPAATGLVGRCRELARAHPGWEFDEAQGVLAIPASQLFERGTDRLRPEALAWLGEAATLWDAPGGRDLSPMVVGRNETSAVRRAGLPDGPSKNRPLGHDRAVRVRDVLAGSARVDPARIEVAGFEVPGTGPDPGDEGPDSAAWGRNRRIEIHLRSRGEATPTPSATPAPTPAGRSDP